MTNIPVLVGVAQLEQRVAEPGSGKEPIDLMIEAVQNASMDAECPALLTGANSIRVIRGMWPYGNPATAISEAIGAKCSLWSIYQPSKSSAVIRKSSSSRVQSAATARRKHGGQV